MLHTRACAKVNLLLALRGKRSDGYHELHTLFDELDLDESLRFEPSASEHALRLEVKGAPEGFPVGEDNLVLRAARALREAWGAELGGCFRLEKALPSGAGLGGGSADAAAALRLYARALGRDPASDAVADELEELAREIGADVAFFIRGGRALAYGRGDEIHAVSRIPRVHYALLLPDLHCDTAAVFREVRGDEADARASAPCHGAFPSAELNDALDEIPSCSDVRRARLRDPARSHALLESCVGPRGLLGGLFNELTAPALRAYPRLDALRATLIREGFTDLHLSGSGSTFFLAALEGSIVDSAARSLEALVATLRADGFEGLGSAPRVVRTSSRTG